MYGHANHCECCHCEKEKQMNKNRKAGIGIFILGTAMVFAAAGWYDADRYHVHDALIHVLGMVGGALAVVSGFATLISLAD